MPALLKSITFNFMGWTFTQKSYQTTREFFERQFNYDKPEEGKSGKVIACSATWAVAYLAYEVIAPGKRDVVAIVCLIRHVPRAVDGYNFGYKDMEECMGPYESKCPETILKLLTPTTNESAIEWRARCWERINKRKNAPKVHKGDWIKFSQPLTFASGITLDCLQWVSGSKFSGPGYGLYRISNWKEREHHNLGKLNS
jgi:hypothetical protein